MSARNLPPGVVQDPETGRFVSVDDADRQRMTWTDTEVFTGAVWHEIPAADLSGQTQAQLFEERPGSELIDFGQELDNDEVFEALTIDYGFKLYAHTTATAEGYVEAATGITANVPASSWVAENTPFFGNIEFQNGIIDSAVFNDETEEEWLANAFLAAEPSHSDTTNAVAAGAMYDEVRRLVPLRLLYGTGPMYDDNDSLFAPVHFNVDNVSDHAVGLAVYCLVRGPIHVIE